MLSFACCASVFAADAVGKELKAVRAEIDSNSVDRTHKCRYYKAWYNELCTKDELNAMLERNIAAHRRWMELDPNSFYPYVGLGRTLAAVGRWDEAKLELEKAVSAPADKLSDSYRVGALWELANCHWAMGDKDGAKKLIAEIATTDWNDTKAVEAKRAKYLHYAWTDRDADLDLFKLPHSVDGKPFPTPQEATYGEKKVALSKVEVKFRTSGTEETSPSSRISPVSPESPIIHLLKRKFSRFGVKFSPGGTPIEIEISPDAPVDKPQGYSLDVANGKVVIKARSRLGALWGVVSLIQCVDRGELAIREMTIRDWPKCLRRGVVDYWHYDCLEYVLFNKMNSLTICMDLDYAPSPLDRERYRVWGSRFKDFGLEMYHGNGHLAMTPMLPLSSPRSYKFHSWWARFLASIGMGFSFHLDDHRFPVHPADLKAAGTAANLDMKYLTRIYREVKKDYPDFKMQFCPPFYWGPDGIVGNRYTEPRDAYLKAIGTDLDPEIDVYWTGPRVKSAGMTVEKTKWYSDLVGRKPTIWHNGNCIGQHNYIQYGADTTGFKKSHCPEIFDMIAAFQQNTSCYQEMPMVGSAMDWCWNPDAHDAETSVRRAVEQLEGPGVYEIVRDATPSISYFDRYAKGEPRSELFSEDQADLDRRVATGEKAWSKVLSVAKNGGLFVGNFNRFAVTWAKQLANYLRNPPKWLLERRDAEMANTKFAVEEAGYDESKGDLFFPAELLSGGVYHSVKDRRKKDFERGVKYLNVGEELSAKFACDPFPPEAVPRLFVCATSFVKEKPLIEIEVNGQSIWRGEAFDARCYAPMEVEVPVHALKRYGNRLVIRNVSTEAERKPLVHYVVIKK